MDYNYIKKKSKKQEERTAKEFGGREQVASGALWGAKGDVRTGGERTSSFNSADFLIENKFTDKNYYLFKRKVWEKIKDEALHDNFRTPLMQIDILDDLEIVLMDFNDFKAFQIEDHLDVEMESVEIYKGSFRIKHKELSDMFCKAYREAKTPAYLVEMKFGDPVRVVIMRKDDFIYVLDKVEQ